MNALNLKISGWIWQVTILSVVLGMLLGAALKTQENVRRVSGIPTTRVSGLAQLLLDEKDRNRLLQKEIRDLREQVDQYERTVGEGGAQAQILKDELRKARFLAGLLPAQGPGITVTLRDYPKAIPSGEEPELLQEYIIHDFDLRNFVNELYANGAEAISISDKDTTQRLISSSAIRCSSGVIMVNNHPMASPFTISAIGPPNPLKTALEMHNGLLSQFRFIDGLAANMVTIKTQKNVQIPAFSGNTGFIYAVMEPEKKPK